MSSERKSSPHIPIISPWFFTKEELQNTPSRRDGVSEAAEMQQRRKTCAFISDAGQKLRLPQLTIATAIVFFHRFFIRQSFKQHDRSVVAKTCLFLAGKVEETPKKLRDVITVSYALLMKTKNMPKELQEIKQDSQEFWELKENILVAERILLQTIGFDLTIEHPYKHLLAYVKKIEGSKDLAQVAWNFVNDSFRTTLCLQYQPKTVAAAAIYLASKFLKHPLPTIVEGSQTTPWWVLFETKVEDMRNISNQILDLYESTSQVGIRHPSSWRPLFFQLSTATVLCIAHAHCPIRQANSFDLLESFMANGACRGFRAKSFDKMQLA